MTQPQPPQAPIGYWLKHVDQLLSKQIDQAQATNGVSRSEWQILNILHETAGASRGQIFETMRTFVDADRLDELLSRLIERGWVEQRPGAEGATSMLQLSAAGSQQHAAILATQKQVRQRAMDGISAADYATTLRVLQRMASNLESGGTA